MEFSVAQHYFTVKAGGKKKKSLSVGKKHIDKNSIKVTLVSSVGPAKDFKYLASLLLKFVVGIYSI